MGAVLRLPIPDQQTTYEVDNTPILSPDRVRDLYTSLSQADKAILTAALLHLTTE